jgi:magnesium-transporting ATPase (P-type)
MNVKQLAHKAAGSGRRKGADKADKAGTDAKTPTSKAESKPGATPAANDDLKSLPLPEVKKRLGYSSDGLSAAEAKKRLTQYGPNEITEKKFCSSSAVW